MNKVTKSAVRAINLITYACIGAVVYVQYSFACSTASCDYLCFIVSTTTQLEEATDYELRSQIRKAIRNKKKATGKDVGLGKKTGAATYRRPGFQAPKLLTLPNSVTGNVLPDKVNMDTHTITDKGSTVISYMGLETTKPPRGVVPKSKAKDGVTTSPARQSTSSARQTSVSSSPRGSVSSTKVIAFLK